MASTDTPARDAVLVKYLNEAYGKEKQLEQNLTVLIGRANNHKTLKKGLQEHLRVTKAQSRGLQQRIKALGGKAEVGPDLPGPDIATSAAGAVANVANRALATAKGPVQMLRGTGEADNMLRNVRDAFWNEAEEIAHYDVIQAVATKLKDTETVKLAKQYRREEERMQTFLGREITKLAGEVVKEEVPARERRTTTTRRRRSTRSSSRSASSSSSRSRSASSGSSSRSSSSSSRSTSSRKAAGQKAAATRTRKAATSSAKSTAKSARTTAKKAGTTARKAGSAARSTAKRATS
jgi:ferritin-like metal-binding protein YciE